MNVFLFFPQTHVCDIQNPQWLFFAKNPLGNLQNYFCSRDCVSSISNSAKVWKQISKLFWSSLPTLHIFSSAECSVVLIRFSMIENKNGRHKSFLIFQTQFINTFLSKFLSSEPNNLADPTTSVPVTEITRNEIEMKNRKTRKY